jgi:hypothetical protein
VLKASIIYSVLGGEQIPQYLLTLYVN